MSPKMPAAAPAPKAPEPVRVPGPQDPDVMANRRQRTQEEFEGRRGRRSTQLAPDQGGAAYSRTTLG
jgi:hypothetical protein